MKKYAVIVAAGSGQRMGSNVPKQFLLLNGLPVLHYSIKAFVNTFDNIEIILVLPAEHVGKGEEIIANLNLAGQVRLTIGGDTRFQSVKNGLQFIDEPSIVFVHDGVRCLVTADLLKRCYEQAKEKGSAIPAITPIDSLRIISGAEHQVIDRNVVRIIQTPQTFKSEILLTAFEQPYQPSFTDEATVVEASGKKINLAEGEYENIKITRQTDLWTAEKILQNRSTLKPT